MGDGDAGTGRRQARRSARWHRSAAGPPPRCLPAPVGRRPPGRGVSARHWRFRQDRLARPFPAPLGEGSAGGRVPAGYGRVRQDQLAGSLQAPVGRRPAGRGVPAPHGRIWPNLLARSLWTTVSNRRARRGRAPRCEWRPAGHAATAMKVAAAAGTSCPRLPHHHAKRASRTAGARYWGGWYAGCGLLVKRPEWGNELPPAYRIITRNALAARRGARSMREGTPLAHGLPAGQRRRPKSDSSPLCSTPHQKKTSRMSATMLATAPSPPSVEDAFGRGRSSR